MVTRQDVLSRVSPYKNHWVLLKKYQRTPDIIKAITLKHGTQANDYDKISEMFWRGNALDTAKYLFDFCKQNVSYKIEPDKLQSVRSPAAIMSMGNGDCKHYASFIVGVLDSLKRKGYKVDPIYRFASYKMYDRVPHHVFAVIKVNGDDVWIDPVLRYFNERKQYFSKTDKRPSMLVGISGIGYAAASGIGKKNPAKKAKRQAKKATKKRAQKPKVIKRRAKRAEGKTRRAAKRAARPKGLKAKLKRLNPLLVTARNSYLLLLKMNLFHLASKIGRAVAKDPSMKDKLKQIWVNKAGGDWANYLKAVNQGIRVWNKHHKDKVNSIGFIDGYNRYAWDNSVSGVYVNGVGVVQFAGAAAILTAALAIIKLFAPLLKSKGIETKESIEEGEQAAQDIADQVENASKNGEAVLETGGPDTGEYAGDGSQVEGTPKTGPAYAYSVTTNPDGSKTLNVKGSSIDKMEQQDGGGSGVYDDGGGGNAISDFFATAKRFVFSNKKWFIWGGLGLIALYVIPKAIRAASGGTRKRRR